MVTIFCENRHRYTKEIVTVTRHFRIARITGLQIMVAILTNCAKSKYLIKIQLALYFSLCIKKSTSKYKN